MIDWLRRPVREELTLDVGDRRLPLVIRRLGHARRMTLRLSADGAQVRLSMPRWGRTADGLAFALGQTAWLAAQLERCPEPAPALPGGTIAFRGAALAIAHEPTAPRKPQLQGAAISIGGPAQSLPARLRRWLEGEALRHLAEDLAHYCTRAGLTPPRLALSNAQRRWGSCAHDGSIRINWRLIMAPDFVRRSVVAHEVAHLVHFDHSPRFHALLGEIYEGDIREANRWLKREGRRLYSALG